MTLAEMIKVEGRNEGKREGKIEGRIEGQLEIAKSLLCESMSPHFIAKVTDLPLAQVIALQASLMVNN